MFCTECGKPIPEGNKFCTNCGAPVEQPDQPAAPAQPEPQPMPVAQPAPAVPAQAAPATQTAGGQTRKPTVAGTVALAAVAAVITFLVVLVLTGVIALPGLPSGEDPAATATTTEAPTASDAPAQATTASVPDLAGLSLDEAKAALTSAGLTVDTVTTKPSDTVAKGAVVSQSATGTVAPGTSVDLVCSLGRKVYQVVHQDTTWEAAEAYCQQQGGHLASITTPGEWAQVEGLMAADGHNVYAIGATRASGDSFAWADGSDFTFSAWAAGEPNNDPTSNAPEDYVWVYQVDGAYAWYDSPSDLGEYYKSSVLGFVMETYE